MTNGIALDSAEIHLWFANQREFLDQGITLESLRASHGHCLSEAEQARFERFHFDADRYQLLLTRVLLHKLLAEYFPAVAASSWEFSTNAYGKPRASSALLPASRQPSFNVSNTAEHIVIALSTWPMLGIDIEGRSRVRLIEKIAQRYFSPAEISALLKLPAASRQHRFYQLWTLKEAYIKACGMGLAIPLDHFSFSFENGGVSGLDFSAERKDDPSDWQCWQLNMLPEVETALAIKAAAKPVSRLRSWRMRGLTETQPLTTDISGSLR